MKAFPNGVVTNKDGLIVGSQQGMDLRDWFARLAMQAMVSRQVSDPKHAEDYAHLAYMMADKMIEQREL